MKRNFFIMIVILLTAACNGNSDNNDEQRSITVLPFQSPCFTMEQTLCLVTKTGASDQTNMIANEIIGFEHLWGYTYDIAVIVKDITPPSADGSNKSFTLKSVDNKSEDEVGTIYEITNVELLDRTITKEDSVYFFIGKEFSCENLDLCESLLGMNNSGGIVDIQFEYIGDGEISLKSWM